MKKIYQIFIILLMTFNLLSAIPASNQALDMEQPDGNRFTAKLKGDEWRNWYETLEGYTIAQDQSGIWMYVKSSSDAGFEFTRTPAHLTQVDPDIEKHILPPYKITPPDHSRDKINLQNNRTEFTIPLVLIDYPNMPFTYPESNFDDLMNQEGYSGYQGQTGSFKDYYVENSYGEFVPTAVVMDWVTASNEFQDYGDNASNGSYLVKQMIGMAIDAAEEQGMDWSQFDNDGNGTVDALNVVHAGPGAEEGNGNYIWSHKWSLGSEARYYDGVTINSYTINPEKQSTGYLTNSGMVHIGVICHEFGHALGLPDLYDTDYSTSGVGVWAVMSGGSWGGNSSSPWYPVHFTAWSKYDLGWVDPVIVTEGSITHIMDNVEENPLVYMMTGTGNDPDEYFLFENRQKIKYDQHLPNSGLLIWHIDEDVGSNSNEWHRKVDLEQADGFYDLNMNQGNGDAADSWPGTFNKTIFAFETLPNSLYYNENASGISVVNISESDGIVTATFRNHPNLVVDSSEFSEIVGDSDGVPNPGETLNMLMSFYNPSESAINELELIVESNNPQITIVSPEATLTNAAPYALLNMENPIQFNIDSNIDLGIYQLQLYFLGELGNGELFEQQSEFSVEVSINQEGFPLIISDNIISSPALVDLTGNGEKDIVFGTESGFIYAISPTGRVLQGEWPIETGNEIWGAPAVADVDGDGENEIIFTSKDKHLYILDTAGNIELDFDAEQYLTGTPAIGNLDEDEMPEIIFGGMSSSGKLFVINSDGSSVNPNFPLILNEKMYTGASVIDLNSDGLDEIIICTKSGYVHVIDHNAEELEGFPFESVDDIRSAPIVSDIDFDYSKEILFGDDSGLFTALNLDGSINFEFQAEGAIRTSASIFLSQTEMQIYFGTNAGYLYSLNGFGEVRNGWPKQFNSDVKTSPVFADLENDGQFEIIMSSFSDGIMIFDFEGNELFTFQPNVQNDVMSFECSPLVADLDMDGDLEIVSGYSEGMYALDFKEIGTPAHWNVFRGDMYRTGVYDIQNYFLMGDVNMDTNIDVLDIIAIVNHILEYNPLNVTQFQLADLNDDGFVNIQDIILIVGIIMS